MFGLKPDKWRSLIRLGSLSTFAQLIGRMVNFFFPILLLARFGGSAETDSFFLVLAGAFYVAGTLANSAADALIPYILAYKPIIRVRSWLLASVLIGTLAITICLFFLPETPFRLMLALVVGGLLIAISGFYSSRLVALCYAHNDFVTPGISWLYRGLVFFPLFLVAGVVESLAYCMLALGLGDLLRLGHLSRTVKKLDLLEVKVDSTPPTFRYFLAVMVGGVVMGLNPIVDRFVASTLAVGQVSVLEMSERLSGLFTMVLTVGLLQVLHVEISRVVNDRIAASKLSRLLGSVFFSVTFLVLLVIAILELVMPMLSQYVELNDFVDVQLYVYILLLSAPATITGMVCARILIAFNQSLDIMVIGIVATLMNVVLSIWLAAYIELTGILLATLLVYSITMLLLMRQVKLRVY